jgi:hypothetical protein
MKVCKFPWPAALSSKIMREGAVRGVLPDLPLGFVRDDIPAASVVGQPDQDVDDSVVLLEIDVPFPGYDVINRISCFVGGCSLPLFRDTASHPKHDCEPECTSQALLTGRMNWGGTSYRGHDSTVATTYGWNVVPRALDASNRATAYWLGFADDVIGRLADKEQRGRLSRMTGTCAA